MSRDRRLDPEEMAPGAAVDLWLDRKRGDTAESTVYTYSYQLKLFREWCEEVGIETVDQLRPSDLDQFKGVRSRHAENITLLEELKTLRRFIDYLDNSLDAVEDGLAEAIDLPNVDQAEKSNETILATEDALALLSYYRDAPEHYGTRDHVLVELAWFTGARRGGLRALDIRDVHFEDGYLDFVHRPETGTPLKNKIFGERSVALEDRAVEALRRYVDQHRYDIHDDENRQPLLASRVGRPTPTTITDWSYRATQPCIHSDCPHGKYRETCDYTQYNDASKCPSSRSPHPIRGGSITWQLNRGIPPEVVAGRVNATIETIRWYYDWATEDQRWSRLREHREQRAQYIGNLGLES